MSLTSLLIEAFRLLQLLDDTGSDAADDAAAGDAADDEERDALLADDLQREAVKRLTIVCALLIALVLLPSLLKKKVAPEL